MVARGLIDPTPPPVGELTLPAGAAGLSRPQIAFLRADAYLPARFPAASRQSLALRLAEVRRRLPENPANHRIFAAPPPAEETVYARWAASRQCALAVIRAQLDAGMTSARLGLSISHCPAFAAALSWDRGNESTADDRATLAGIDLEPRRRRISAGAVARFTSPCELASGLSALELWCIKEAAYKATPLTRQTAIVPDYAVVVEIDPSGAPPRTGTVTCGKDLGRSFRFTLLEHDECVVAIVGASAETIVGAGVA